MRQRDLGLVTSEWVQRRVAAIWRLDAVRGVLLLFYYLAIIVVLVHIYGSGTYTPPPFIYQGF